jgi:hypothetical protein
MIALPLTALFIVVVVALIAGRRHPSIPIALFACGAGILIGDGPWGSSMAHFISAAFALFS